MNKLTVLESEHLRYEGETLKAWKERMRSYYQKLTPFKAGKLQIDWALNETVLVSVLLPTSPWRSHSECSEPIPPYELRNDDDDLVIYSASGLAYSLFASYSEACAQAQQRANLTGVSHQVVNAFGNTVEGFDPEEEE